MTSTNPPLLVPFKEACRLLGIGRTTLYGLIERGEVRSIKLGKVRQIPAEEISRLVAGEPALSKEDQWMRRG